MNVDKAPDSWTRATLGDVCEVVGGSTPKTAASENWGGDIAWLTPNDLSGYTGKYIAHGERFITQVGYDSTSTKLMPEGSVLFTSRAPIGYVAIASQAVCTNQGFKSFVPSPDLNSEFLYWYLRYATPTIQQMGSGTTFKEISGKVAKTVPIAFPAIDEQRRIVEAIETHLSHLDAGVESLERAERNLGRMRAAIFEAAANGSLVSPSATEHGLDLNLSGRPPDTPPTFELPAGWSWVSIEQLSADTQIGLVRSRKEQRPEPPGKPYVRMNSVTEIGEVLWDSLFYVDVSEKDARRFELNDGDVLFNTRNSLELVGKTGLVRHPPEGTVYNNNLMRIRCVADVLSDFLNIVMNSPSFKARLHARKSATTNVAAVYAKSLLPMGVGVPPLDEQHRIIDEVDRQTTLLDGGGEEVRASRRRSRLLRAAVLGAAFNGALTESPRT